uniref:hypothetical protein n=1 Tax=Thaumasiovibrio occultus TaxID=1891184 RepID=UPI000B34D639|nr:hypothetical protein [Thaumasiovibrio occultus]
MKHTKVLAALLLCGSLPVSANYGIEAGIFLGSPTSGVIIKPHPMFKFAMGVDTFSVSGDVVMPLSSLISNSNLAPVYAFGGLQYVDDNEHTFGPRFGLGLELPIGHSQLVTAYAEAGTTWYIEKSADMKLEGQLGLRFRF